MYLPIFILFGYKNGIGKPIRVVHFLNETVESLLDGLGLRV
jgi:hypothetical protein